MLFRSPVHNSVFIQCRGEVLHLNFSFLISFAHVGQDAATKARHLINTDVVHKAVKKISASGQMNDLSTDI